jgi:hypothetical protein
MAKGKNHSSKRTTLHQKYKIQKRVKDHHRKIRKDEKNKVKKGVKLAVLKKKDPGIPNLWPFKEELLREVEVHKETVAKQKVAEKLERQRQREKARKAGMTPAQQMAELKASALGRQATFEMQEVGTSWKAACFTACFISKAVARYSALHTRTLHTNFFRTTRSLPRRFRTSSTRAEPTTGSCIRLWKAQMSSVSPFDIPTHITACCWSLGTYIVMSTKFSVLCNRMDKQTTLFPAQSHQTHTY